MEIQTILVVITSLSIVYYLSKGFLFAIIWKNVSKSVDRELQGHKAVLFGFNGSGGNRYGGECGGTVLEIGAGVGANLRYLDHNLVKYLILNEPNANMHTELLQAATAAGFSAQQTGKPVTILSGNAEKMGLKKNSVDTVICTLVLCSVSQPSKIIGEIHRVLKPGGHSCNLSLYYAHLARKLKLTKAPYFQAVSYSWNTLPLRKVRISEYGKIKWIQYGDVYHWTAAI